MTAKKDKEKRFLIIGAVVLGFVLIWFLSALYYPVSPGSKETVSFRVEKGESLNEIAGGLSQAGLIRSKTLFIVLAVLEAKQDRLLAGNYDLSPSMSIPHILGKLTSGEVAVVKLTVIEGWTSKEIAQWFEEQGMFQIQDFQGAERADFSDNFAFLYEKPKEVGLEGYLFPDTYLIDKSASADDVIKLMLANFEKNVFSQLAEEIEKQGKTLFQVLTMASLLEKELKTYQDKQMGAGILWKRLEAGWPLQVDATLTYLTGKDSQGLTKEDMAIDSPYNTYKYAGLPLGPICNPGLQSIEAAVRYRGNPYWFYLSSADGTTFFSKTLEEHNINKAKYLR